jgi:hypothetical protein
VIRNGHAFIVPLPLGRLSVAERLADHHMVLDPDALADTGHRGLLVVLKPELAAGGIGSGAPISSEAFESFGLSSSTQRPS